MRQYVVLLFAALTGCGLSNGQCEIPKTEKQIRDSLAINLIKKTFQSNEVTDKSPSVYLQQNPNCCSVKPKTVSFLEWVLWDRYSLPKYEVQANTAYRKEGATFIYYNFGNGDSCGRVPDTFGEETIVQGIEPVDTCSFSKADRLNAVEPLICSTKPKTGQAAISVQIDDARNMSMAKDSNGL